MSEDRKRLLHELLKEAAGNGCLQDGQTLRIDLPDGSTVVTFVSRPLPQIDYTRYDCSGGWPPGC